MDVRRSAEREARSDHHGTATSWYLVDRDELKEQTDGTHLEYVTEFEIRAGGVLEAHFHNNYEWFYVLEGEGTMTIEDEDRDVAPGALIAIPPNAVHSLRPHGEQALRCLCWGLNLSKDGSRYHEPEPA